MKYLATLVSLFLIAPLFSQDDYKVEDLPFYKVGQLEKEKLYINTAQSFVDSKNALEATKFITDTSPEEVAEFTKAYRKFHQDRTGEVAKDLIIFGYRGNQFAHITMETRSKVQSVCQIVWERQMDSPKIDWRATYGYSETTWDEFFQTKPQIPTSMRTRLAKGNYYNFKYADDKIWICLKCYHPYLKKELFAYVKHHDPAFQEMIESINLKGHIDVTAEFFFPEDAKDWKQVEIQTVLHNTWFKKDYYNE